MFADNIGLLRSTASIWGLESTSPEIRGGTEMSVTVAVSIKVLATKYLPHALLPGNDDISYSHG